MFKSLLKKYIMLSLGESKFLSRKKKTDNEKDNPEEISEFSGVGSIAGYVGPLGVHPDDLGRKKNK